MQPKRTVTLKTIEALLSEGWAFKDYPGTVGVNHVALIKGDAVFPFDLVAKLGNENIVYDSRIPVDATVNGVTEVKEIEHLNLGSGLEVGLFLDGSAVFAHRGVNVDLNIADVRSLYEALTVLNKESIL